MFFEGFKMIRKHKNKVLLLVKTMRGADLKCFKENTLWELEDRFLAEDLSDT
jgi:phosphatidylinositol 4-kinase